MVTIRQEQPGDVAAREALLDLAYGPARFGKPSQRLRKGRPPARELSFVAVDGNRIVGTVRLWRVSAGADRPALLLGPLAVAPDARNRGIGSALMRRALGDAARLGHAAVLLVGDAAFYGRFGFTSAKTGALRLPSACEQHRLLACELIDGALDRASGFIAAGSEAPARAARTPATTGFRRNHSVAASRAA